MWSHFLPATKTWFEATLGTPTNAQAQAWPSIREGRATLIAAPTGSGKTLAAFLASIDALLARSLAGDLAEETSVLYISPLKALSNDIQKNLQQPLAGISALLPSGVVRPRAEVRTGDTPPSVRQRMVRNPPHILVTTPESLYLLLTSESGRKMLSTVRTTIVDEIHALVEDRRGAHLALSLERLEALVGGSMQRIGLSATQKPVETVANFLVGERFAGNAPDCHIVDEGHRRALDLAIELPDSALEAVMSNDVWEEIYDRLAQLIGQHETTLVFVNTRRMSERVTRALSERLGAESVTSHHGSLSTKRRLLAETRLKTGDLKALVATASLELGIDIGSVDLVCQIGSTRAIHTLLQRVGRAGHWHGGTSKGRLFPLSRDELVECVALLRCVKRGDLETLLIPENPIDVLAQQIVADTACREWDCDELYATIRKAHPYRNLSRSLFDEVVELLAAGYDTKRGRRGAYVHHDSINSKLRGRRAARLTALTCGGAIPDNADYRVILQDSLTPIGTINEDFAIESMPGDVFQLGNASWRIQRVINGAVIVEDARGQPPSIPFWLGEAPARSDELSRAVVELRERGEALIADPDRLVQIAEHEWGIPAAAGRQLCDYWTATHAALGVLPTQRRIVVERFFDEAGGMQLILHSPFGARLNRAWGLALRKRFCRSFNFELQAAANEDAIVLSLSTQHSFPLEDVLRFLNSATVRDVLVQALLDAPMFQTRWRWNASRSLAIARSRAGKRTPANILRIQAEELLASVFPDQVACLENIRGDREVPDHALVTQTIDDCLHDAMNIDGLEQLLRDLESGAVTFTARDLPEPSAAAHEIINARPYAFLDDAPLEERRTRAVYSRRALPSDAKDLGRLDPEAVARVREESWPSPRDRDELHEALLDGVFSIVELEAHGELLAELHAEGRVVSALHDSLWIATERLTILRCLYEDAEGDRDEALLWAVRGRLEVAGPVTAAELAFALQLSRTQTEAALLRLEAEGAILRGEFTAPGQWCERRLLARIHRLTLNRLRREIEPVSPADYYRFLLHWQHVDAESRLRGFDGLSAVVAQLDGYELAAGAWSELVLPARVADFDIDWLNTLCASGLAGWGRLSGSSGGKSTIRSTPIALFLRQNVDHWLAIRGPGPEPKLGGVARRVLHHFESGGASFFSDVVRGTGLLRTQVEESLCELVAAGLINSDGLAGLRVLLMGAKQKRSRALVHGGFEGSGRWSRLGPAPEPREEPTRGAFEIPNLDAVTAQAWTLLRRYGVVFRSVLERESGLAPWRDIARVLRDAEARGEIRGGRFVATFSGEQFALPEAVATLRKIRNKKPSPEPEVTVLSACDPLNLVGVLVPGERVTASPRNKLLLVDGAPVASLEAGKVRTLVDECRLTSELIDAWLGVHRANQPPSTLAS